MNKLIGLAAIVLGFLATAAGYRYSAPGYYAGGIALVLIGLIFLVLKIARRNQN
ncbi:hypothetical protein [Mesorhizobium sp. 1B3]|uniref:hypothetical protein n=1 Tax=Mesorhizobium sp. 1B3 TaxID=3243599 RepID=UPI003D9900E4